jgi:perosamine synthetase
LQAEELALERTKLFREGDNSVCKKKQANKEFPSDLMRDFIPIAKPVTGSEEVEAVAEVLRSGFLTQGESVRRFEDQFSEYLGVRNSVAVCNGTVALDLALKALDLPKGGEVIVPAFTFIASANSVLYQDLRPRFADVDPASFNIDPDDLQEKINPKTEAVMGVHLYGQPFDLKAVSEICEDHHLPMIEDSAQAHGAEFEGRKAGSFGIGCFSFYPTKNMTTGEGGMITSSDDELADRLRLLRNHGDRGKYNHVALGYNYRMTNIQAAIGLVQLGRLEEFNERRIENALYYNDRIRIKGLSLPHRAEGTKHVYNQYVVKVEDDFPVNRDKLMEILQSMSIGSAVHYPKPVYRQPFYRDLGLDNDLCPVAEDVSRKVLSIPVHPALQPEDRSYIAETINGISDRAMEA